MIYFLFALVSSIIGYLIGSILFAHFAAKIFFKKDIRSIGSNNPGATNISRSFGFKWGFLIALLDGFKSIVAVAFCHLFFYLYFKNDLAKINDYQYLNATIYLAGVFCIIGHCFPINWLFLSIFKHQDKERNKKAKGGKGVATAGGFLFALNPYIGVISFFVWLTCLLITKYVSVSSMICLFLPSLFCLIPEFNLFYMLHDYKNLVINLNENNLYIFFAIAFCFFNNLLVIYQHKENIKRLINKKENKSRMAQKITAKLFKIKQNEN